MTKESSLALHRPPRPTLNPLLVIGMNLSKSRWPSWALSRRALTRSLGVTPRRCIARNPEDRNVTVRVYVLYVAEGLTNMGKRLDTRDLAAEH